MGVPKKRTSISKKRIRNLLKHQEFWAAMAEMKLYINFEGFIFNMDNETYTYYPLEFEMEAGNSTSIMNLVNQYHKFQTLIPNFHKDLFASYRLEKLYITCNSRIDFKKKMKSYKKLGYNVLERREFMEINSLLKEVLSLIEDIVILFINFSDLGYTYQYEDDIKPSVFFSDYERIFDPFSTKYRYLVYDLQKKLKGIEQKFASEKTHSFLRNEIFYLLSSVYEFSWRLYPIFLTIPILLDRKRKDRK